ncbi:jg122, partial [Pararge aegeria aegeria]
SSSDSVLTTGTISERITNLQQSSEQSLQPHVASTLQRNRSSLHSGSQTSLGGSMTSLTSAPPTPAPASSLSTSDLTERPRVSHGKPNLAPKPPTVSPAPDRPSPPPKKLIVNGKLAARAQSMRMPR